MDEHIEKTRAGLPVEANQNPKVPSVIGIIIPIVECGIQWFWTDEWRDEPTKTCLLGLKDETFGEE